MSMLSEGDCGLYHALAACSQFPGAVSKLNPSLADMDVAHLVADRQLVDVQR